MFYRSLVFDCFFKKLTFHNYSMLLRHSCVPDDFCFGVIKPLLKSKHGDLTKVDMYRGITLTPVISKLFETVLLSLYGKYL